MSIVALCSPRSRPRWCRTDRCAAAGLDRVSAQRRWEPLRDGRQGCSGIVQKGPCLIRPAKGRKMGHEEPMSDAYIEQRDGVYMVSESRVSLDSIVYAFLSGQSAEAIAQAFS